IVHWNYEVKYASNPVIDFLRDKAYEHRVTDLPFRGASHLPQYDDYWEELYRIEWIQQLFPFYNIQSLDIVMQPRVAADLDAYLRTFSGDGQPDKVYLVARNWQLSDNRYLLGPAGYIDALNNELDP